MLGGILLALSVAWAGGWQSGQEAIWDAKARKFISLMEFQANAGDIVVLGEDHASIENAGEPETYIHHYNQMRLIAQLQSEASTQAATVSVGIEFFAYTFQSEVDLYVRGALPEKDFLKYVQWGGNPFEFYRRQVLAPEAGGGRTLALNIPRAISAKVAKSGRDSLNEREKLLLPPVWNRGNAAYFERFSAEMKGHVPPPAIENYFWAQSLWDATMTWKALEHRKQLPRDILLIIVGAFHVEYGGGLPHELRRQGGARVKTVVQVATPDWEPATIRKAVEPHPLYGARADYIWLHTGEVKTPSIRIEFKIRAQNAEVAGIGDPQRGIFDR